MKQSVEKDPNYATISICDRWVESFDNFIEDMGYCPDAMTLDRIDPKGDYEPGNCRWTNNSIKNKKRIHEEYISLAKSRYELNGETKTLQEWCEQYNIAFSTVKSRISSNWTIEEAIITPPSTPGQKIKKPNQTYEYSGISLSLEKWAAISGWQVRSLRLRIQQGMSIKDAITTPVKSNRSKFIAPTEDQLKLMILDYYDKYGLEFD